MDTSENYISKCAELYTHINKPELIANEQGVLNLPTNRFLALESIRTWYDNAIFRPIAISTRPEAAIKYMVFSVINTLSGRLLANEYPQLDPYFAINRLAYEKVYSTYGGFLKLTDGQLKLAVLLVEKINAMKAEIAIDNISQKVLLDWFNKFLCEEFLNYLSTEQLLFMQCVMGSVSASGQSMWCIDDKTSRLFDSPNDLEMYYSFINDDDRDPVYRPIRKPQCDASQLEHYISRSICTLFDHPLTGIRLTLDQLYDAINILDMPSEVADKLWRYMWILTPEQAKIV